MFDRKDIHIFGNLLYQIGYHYADL